MAPIGRCERNAELTQSCLSLPSGLDIAALDEVGNALEDVGHLAHRWWRQSADVSGMLN